MRIHAFDWDFRNIDHMARHGVSPEEVEEACYPRPFILKGREGLYLIYGQTRDGRYLFVAARYQGQGILRAITARDMTASEKKLCQNRR